MAKKKTLFHEDNSPVHTFIVPMAKISYLTWELLPHVPFSTYLSPSHYFLFPNSKIWVGGKILAYNGEIDSAFDSYLEKVVSGIMDS